MAQPNSITIALKKEPVAVRSATFSLAHVRDNRPIRSNVGHILSNPKDYLTARLSDDVTDTFTSLLRPVLLPDSARVPVTFVVKNLSFSEKAKSDVQADGTCRLELVFEVIRDNQPIQLTTYTAQTHYTRTFGQTDRLEYVARRALENAAQYLSDWIKVNRDKSPALVKGIRFLFKDHILQQPTSDTVFYHALRQLTWDDFLGTKPPGSQSAASIFSSFSYEGHSHWVNGYIQVELTFRVFMLKSQSWVTLGARDDYSLRHEQNHFDITKMVVERFKQQILADNDMDIDDYNSRIQFLYLEAYRDMNRWQKQYDGETAHGINHTEQQRWDQKVATDLRQAEELTAIMTSNRL